MTDEIAMIIYKKTKLPEKSFFKSFAGCAIRGYKKTTMQIIIDKVNKNNIDVAISEFDDFVKPSYYWDKKGNTEFIEEIRNYLKKIKYESL